jgi:hypothetical protein
MASSTMTDDQGQRMRDQKTEDTSRFQDSKGSKTTKNHTQAELDSKHNEEQRGLKGTM